jgi:hypothetical protein
MKKPHNDEGNEFLLHNLTDERPSCRINKIKTVCWDRGKKVSTRTPCHLYVEIPWIYVAKEID